MMQNSLATPKALGRIGGFSSALVSLIIFFSATQLGLHFWPLSSLVYGVRVDYLSPTLYFLDLLIGLYLAITQGSVLKRNSWLQAKKGSAAAERTDPNGIIIALLPTLIVNLLYSQNPLATLSWSLHLTLYLLFLSSISIYDLRSTIYKALSFSLLFQLALALSQVYLGHSLGGLMYYLGERTVSVGSPGIALGTFMGTVVLRAYGTFSHPNVLAGWSVVALLITIQLRKQRAVRRSDLLGRSWLSAKMFSRTSKTNSETRSDLFGIYFSLLLTTAIVFLTQSRSAALSLFGLIIPFYLIKNLKFRLLYCSMALLLYSTTPLLSPPRSDLSLSQRRTLQESSLSVIRAFPIFGTGANASISTYPSVSPQTRVLQPDHNSFTLFLSWFGLFGVLAILYSLRSFIFHPPFSMLSLVPLLALDHYFLTSPQGLFILMLYLSHSTPNK